MKEKRTEMDRVILNNREDRSLHSPLVCVFQRALGVRCSNDAPCTAIVSGRFDFLSRHLGLNGLK